MVSWFQTRQGEGPRHYYLTPSHIIAWGREKGFLFHFHKAVHSSTVTTTWLWSSQALQWAFLHVNHSLFLHTFLTNIVAAGVCLLISLLFPVNYSILSCDLCHLCIQVFSLATRGLGGRGGGEGERARDSVAWKVTGGELNCGVPFLNHDRWGKQIQKEISKHHKRAQRHRNPRPAESSFESKDAQVRQNSPKRQAL